MQWTIITNYLALFTILGFDIFAIRSLVKNRLFHTLKNLGRILIFDLIVMLFVGGISMILWTIVLLIYSFLFTFFKGVHLEVIDPLSNERIAETKQIFYSLLIFNFLLYIYMLNQNHIIDRDLKRKERIKIEKQNEK